MNTKQLRDVITKELTDLTKGQSTNAKAANVARLASSMIAAKKLEIQVSRHRNEIGQEQEVDL
jgi:hypothetical protein